MAKLIKPASYLTPRILAGKSGTEERYYCPFCVEVRGKPDNEGKLYYNRRRGVGVCHKCETVVTAKEVVTTVTDEASRYVDPYLRTTDSDEKSKVEVVDISWTKSVDQVPEVQKYLSHRKIGRDLIERYRIRAIDDPILGVVLPAKDLGNLKTDFIQIRDIRDKSYVKYRGVSNTDKPLYGSDAIGTAHIGLLAEGVFSAISAARLDDQYAALCTYGKSTSISQIRELNTLDQISEVVVMYDGGFVREGIKTVKSLMANTDKLISIAFLPKDKDPNDLDDCELDECLEDRVKCSQFIATMLLGMYRRSRSYEEFRESVNSSLENE